MATPDVVVVGGGVIGCATAWELARAGASVRVLERDALAAHASGAAAGMLAPVGEALAGDPTLFTLGRRALEAWPATIAALASAGAPCTWNPCGVWRSTAASGVPHGTLPPALRELDCAWRDDAEARAVWPGAHEPLLWSPREGTVDPTALTRAFARAAAALGARFESGVRVRSLERRRDRGWTVRAASGAEHRAGSVVVCAGAWSGALLAPYGAAGEVGPVRGQMIELDAPRRPLPSVLWDGDLYLVPRADGRVWLGATVERAGYDARPTRVGFESLLEAARATWPEATAGPVLRTWSGLRPAAADARPRVGPVPGAPGLWLATAHFRNGILLAHETARALREGLATGKLPEAFRPCAPRAPGSP